MPEPAAVLNPGSSRSGRPILQTFGTVIVTQSIDLS